MSKKYAILVKILDQIREEARDTKWANQYAVDDNGADAIMAARSRAYIHLYLKVMFGIGRFDEREAYITDGSYDGGIDGFFIDKESKRIYLLQSKFRNTEKNFEEKNIDYGELLAMDIERITTGHDKDEAGNQYNGKIQGLIRKISEISDVARFNYQVAILANCSISPQNVRKLTGGFNADVFDFARVYNDLVFPIISGTYFKASDLTIKLDLNNKSAGAKTSYSVNTPSYECEITVLFVPAIEIAEVMDKYRNSVLEFNPRSYLDLDGQNVNAAIKETLLRPDSNEFALMNNGLTILSDETNLNERIGQHNKAQLRLLNPQIINGGQTAYTLGRVLSEDRENAAQRFQGKEVLVKVITLTAKDATQDNVAERRRLIDEISAATNRQTAVITTDKFSNDSIHLDVQKLLFDRFGLLYERKRGEFSDGVFAGYIDRSEVLDRTLFMRLLLTVHGRIGRAVRKRIFAIHGFTDAELKDIALLDRFSIGLELFRRIAPRNTNSPKKFRDALAKVYIGVSMIHDAKMGTSEAFEYIDSAWDELLKQVAQTRKKHVARYVDPETGNSRTAFSPEKWMNSADFQTDLSAFVASQAKSSPSWKIVQPSQPEVEAVA
jgi:hypothetical protein